MNKKTYRRKILASILFITVLCLIRYSVIYADADVTTNTGESGDADTIFIAGNPNLYPIEFYNEESKEYDGVIPDILGKVSSQTNISFTYICAGDKNQQKRLSRNNQVEIVSAVLYDNKSIALKDKYPILRIVADGKEITYCIGFTEIASDELITKLKTAFSKISDGEKAGILLSYTDKSDRVPASYLIIGAVISFISAGMVFSLIVLLIRSHKEKKDNIDRMVDTLTGVGNGNYYVYCFEQLISKQAKSLYNIAYFGFDFEKIENLHGRDVCVDIAKNAAQHINLKLGSNEYISRIQNGDFVVLFQATGIDDTYSRIQSITESLNKYLSEVNLNWQKLYFSGVCRLEDHSDYGAETALLSSKQSYNFAVSNNKEYFVGSSDQYEQYKKDEKLCSQIISAEENGEFKIYLQFIADSKTGGICGAEVLSRWQNSEYGLLRPNEYIELLKKTGRIIDHDFGVFTEICKLLEKWNTPPYNKLFLTCNITRLCLSNTEFADRIRSISEKYSFDRNRLVIEITEDTNAVSSENVASNIKKCREMGFKIAIDDMGSGYSSFADLYENEFDIVKIEKSFINSCFSKRRLKILEDLVVLAHNCGSKVICEGISSKGLLNLVENIGFDMYQGFYFSRVLPISECERLLSDLTSCKESDARL